MQNRPARTALLLLAAAFALTAGARAEPSAPHSTPDGAPPTPQPPGRDALSIQREYPDCGGCGGVPVDTHGGTFYALRAALGWGPDEAHSGGSVLRLCGLGLSYRRPFVASDLTDIWTLAVGCY